MNISSVNVNLLHWQLPKDSVHYKHKYKFTDDNGWYCSTCNSAIRDNFELIKAVKINKQYYIDNRLELDYEYYTSDIAHRYKPLIVADLNEYNSNGDIVPKYWNYNANYEETAKLCSSSAIWNPKYLLVLSRVSVPYVILPN